MAIPSVLWKLAPAPAKEYLIRALYNYISSIDKKGRLTFLNYGYLPVTVKVPDAFNQARAQLYEEVASAVPLKGKAVLEVSSGRGGGAAYLMQAHQPASLIGVDISKNAVDFCTAQHRTPGLSFKVGNAEALPFSPGQFGAVVNIEASHNYGSIDAFVSEVQRVLKPGGHLLFADFRPSGKVADLKSRLVPHGMKLVLARDITTNVVAALDSESREIEAAVNDLSPRPFRGFFRTFAGVKGTGVYNALNSGALQYWNLTVQRL